MSATVQTQEIVAEREDLIEVLAAAQAANEAMMQVGDCPDSSDTVDEIIDRLMRAWFTEADDGLPEPWQRNPAQVEVSARSLEIEAELLELHVDLAGRLEHRVILERAATCRAVALRYRERGTIDVMFQLEEASA